MIIETHAPPTRYACPLLLTDPEVKLFAVARLDRELADAENSFDEMENYWSRSCFAKQGILRCRILAVTLVAVHRWWRM